MHGVTNRAPCATRCAPLRQALPVEWPLQTEARHIFGKDRILGPGFVPQAAPLRCSRRIEHPVYLVARNDEWNPVLTRAVRTCYAYQAPGCCTYQRHRAAGAPRCVRLTRTSRGRAVRVRTARRVEHRRWNPLHAGGTPSTPPRTSSTPSSCCSCITSPPQTCRWREGLQPGRVGLQPLAHRAAGRRLISASSPPHLRLSSKAELQVIVADRKPEGVRVRVRVSVRVRVRVRVRVGV